LAACWKVKGKLQNVVSEFPFPLLLLKSQSCFHEHFKIMHHKITGSNL